MNRYAVCGGSHPCRAKSNDPLNRSAFVIFLTRLHAPASLAKVRRTSKTIAFMSGSSSASFLRMTLTSFEICRPERSAPTSCAKRLTSASMRRRRSCSSWPTFLIGFRPGPITTHSGSTSKTRRIVGNIEMGGPFAAVSQATTCLRVNPKAAANFSCDRPAISRIALMRAPSSGPSIPAVECFLAILTIILTIER